MDIHERIEHDKKLTALIDMTYDKMQLISALILVARQLDNKVTVKPDCRLSLICEDLNCFLNEIQYPYDNYSDVAKHLLPNWQKIKITRRKQGL